MEKLGKVGESRQKSGKRARRGRAVGKRECGKSVKRMAKESEKSEKSANGQGGRTWTGFTLIIICHILEDMY